MPDLHLLLGQDIAGTVRRTTTGSLTFTYDSDYLAKSNPATPVSVSMPAQLVSHADNRIDPWLWGLLPDNDAVLNRWAREFQVSAKSAFALLATPLGEDCPGAVRLIPPDRLAAAQVDQPLTDINWLTEAEVAQRLRDLKNDTRAWLGARRTGRFSLAGAQAKTALLHDGQRWGDPLGTLATSHILKPAIAGLDDHDLNEHICLSAMRVANLRAVRTQSNDSKTRARSSSAATTALLGETNRSAPIKKICVRRSACIRRTSTRTRAARVRVTSLICSSGSCRDPLPAAPPRASSMRSSGTG